MTVSFFSTHHTVRRVSITRIITDVSLYRDLSLGPTEQREVIIEIIFTRSSTEHHGFIHLVMNSLIRDKEKHPWSSVIIRVIKIIRDKEINR